MKYLNFFLLITFSIVNWGQTKDALVDEKSLQSPYGNIFNIKDYGGGAVWATASNYQIAAGDDGICLKSSLHPCKNTVVRNFRVTSHTAPLKFGTSSIGGFNELNVTNCYFYDSPMGAIKLELVDCGRLENGNISRITMENVRNPIFIRLGNRGRDFKKKKNGQSILWS